MKYDQLINKQFHILQRNKINKDKDKFIYNEICSRINLSIDVINLSINNCLEIGFHSKKIEEYIWNLEEEGILTLDFNLDKVGTNLPKSVKNL